MQLCRDHGIPKKQAPEVLATFHQAGIVFYFGKVRWAFTTIYSSWHHSSTFEFLTSMHPS